MLFLPKMKKGLPEGTGPPEWLQQPQISVSLQEGGWVYIQGVTAVRYSQFLGVPQTRPQVF